MLLSEVLTREQVAVRRGVEYIDRDFGKGNWEDRIDVDDIMACDADRCVVGQLYGTFGEIMDAFGIPFGEYEDYGFNGGRAINDAWKELIRERL